MPIGKLLQNCLVRKSSLLRPAAVVAATVKRSLSRRQQTRHRSSFQSSPSSLANGTGSSAPNSTNPNCVSFIENGNFCVRNNMKITVCGALGKVGQPLSLILKQIPIVNELALYDLKETSWLRSDLDLMDTNPKIKAYCGCKNLEAALKGSQIITVVVSDPERTFGSYQEMFQHNADIVHDMVSACASISPSALICIVTNPINSLVPLAVETYKRLGLYGESLIYGVTAFNGVRANSITAAALGLEASCLNIPVIGGAEGETMVPLLSSVPEVYKTNAETIVNITKAIQGECDISDEYGKVIYPYSAAYSVSRFIFSIMKAITSCEDVSEYCFVRSNFRCEAPYLASLVNFGPCGLRKNFGYQKLSEYEQCLLDKAMPILQEQIKLGEKYVDQKYPRC